MKRVISYALFRSTESRFEKPEAGEYRGRFFTKHLPAVLRACAANFPGWEIRIHHDDSLWTCEYGDVLRSLAKTGLVKLVDCGKSPPVCMGMLWRMMPAFDTSVELFICRDLDSVVSPRERRLVDEWIESDLPVHAIHDHHYHAGCQLMGGMTGWRSDAFRQMTGIKSLHQLVELAPSRGLTLTIHGDDQRLLNAVVWPNVCLKTMMHQLKSGVREGTPHMVFETMKRPEDGPEEWMKGPLGERADGGPHIGAVVSEHEWAREGSGTYYVGPTFDPEVVDRRLCQIVELYEDPAWDKASPEYSAARQLIRQAEDLGGEDAMKRTKVRSSGHEVRAVISSSIIRDYAFFLPITSLMWRHVASYKPVVLAIGNPRDWEAHRGPAGGASCQFAIDSAREVGAEVWFIPKMEGHQDSTIAQISRIFAAALPFDPKSYLITGDSDMIPLKGQFFHSMAQGHPFHVLFANAYMMHDAKMNLVPEGKYPICYLAGRVEVWREIMHLGSAGGAIEALIQRQLDEGLGRGAVGGPAWNYDEVLFAHRFKEWPNHDKAEMRNRHGSPPDDRMDRCDWKAVSIDRAVDSHLPRPGHIEENWSRIRPLLAYCLPTHLLKWCDDYRQRFLELEGPA